ncbi:protein ECERIFERUM 2-like [Vicia villosa]|uniref:protein ECERIFERUM 2-like n=1 Tax=Vicia villosa TaxID=3911 RepID=UPI00273C147B|nr:protein ECERIFERUM 2-like [Vicia villosa]
MSPLPNLDTSRISTVVPATPRGEEKSEYNLNYMDLLMKLHYIRSIHLFDSEAVQDLSFSDFKPPMFPLLDSCSHVAGRVRISESGRPFIKCNDAGVRIAEWQCEKSLREWMDEKEYSIDGLVHDHVIGPDVEFSPLVFVKFTYFKCGGLSVGLSWAHILGDAFSAFNFITKWSHTLDAQASPKSFHIPKNLTKPKFLSNSISDYPISVKKATLVDNYWLPANDSYVATHTFYITSKQLHHLATTFTSTKTSTKYFEIVSAMIWKSIAQIRGDFGPRVVTVSTTNISNGVENEFPSNALLLSRIETKISPGESNLSELVNLIAENKMNENHVLEKLLEGSEGKGDFIVYGAKLTFVDLEEGDFYGVKINGKKPIMVNCDFRGVGDEGVVLVLPGPEDDDGNNGRMVTVSLPGKELDQLKCILEKEWGIQYYSRLG